MPSTTACDAIDCIASNKL